VVRAVLQDGSEHELDPALGGTIAELVSGLTATSLSGSAVPLAQAVLKATDGRKFSYGQVLRFEDGSTF
jgi:hypothetical protein